MLDGAVSTSPRPNRLLASLPARARQRLWPCLEACHLPSGWCIGEAGNPLSHLHFPMEAIVARSCATANGHSVAVGLVGAEGVLGLSLFLGGGVMPYDNTVLVARTALRLKAPAMLDEFRRGGAFQAALLRYTQVVLTEIALAVACSRLHPLEQRLGRWLLQVEDRAGAGVLHMTHELLARDLGVRREGVSTAAYHLRESGLIDYHRGHITIADRRRLEAATCECYRQLKAALEHLPGPDSTA